MGNIESNKPGASTRTDDHHDPHGHIGPMKPSGHEGLGRTVGGSFKGMSQGGSSSHGDDMVRKYRGGKGSAPAPAETGYEANDDGDGWK